jgi:hypothetical protein
MEIKKVITAQYFGSYCSYRGIEFTDKDDNEINIRMSYDDYLELESQIISKCNHIRSSRKEELESKLEKLSEEKEESCN